MRIEITFPQDRGVRREVVEVNLSECRGERKIVECIVDIVIRELAERYCLKMGRKDDVECIEGYIYRQGEAMRDNVKAAVVMELRKVMEKLLRCKEKYTKREDIMKCYMEDDGESS